MTVVKPRPNNMFNRRPAENKPTERTLFCFVSSSRGYGNDLHRIVKYGTEEVRLRNTKTGEEFNIYRAHTYCNFESYKADAKERDAQSKRNQQIGLTKEKPITRRK